VKVTDEGLARFNALPVQEAEEQVHACLSVRRWAGEVVGGRPYADRSALLEHAAEAARTLTDGELDEALAGHPRIGERATPGHNTAASAAEQSGVDGSDATVTERLAAANAAYEDRFDRVFIIRAAGRSADDVLAEIGRRLTNDDATERGETIANLREIALLRLEAMT
jgi:2-oxo-4-hydroxy-4-carboxy-5-ureidoimidazoline decarboxylase